MQATITHRIYCIKQVRDSKVLINAKTLWIYISLQTRKRRGLFFEYPVGCLGYWSILDREK